MWYDGSNVNQAIRGVRHMKIEVMRDMLSESLGGVQTDVTPVDKSYLVRIDCTVVRYHHRVQLDVRNSACQWS